MGNNARGEANDMFAILMGANLGETFFFGVYTIIFLFSSVFMLSKRPSTPIRNAMLAVTAVMYTVSAVHWAVNMAITARSLRADTYLVTSFELLVIIYLPTINYILSDGIVVWRAWVVWGPSRRLVLFTPPLLSLVCTLALSAAGAAFLYLSNDYEYERDGVVSRHLGWIVWGFSVGTNLWATSLIFIRMWQHRRAVRSLLGKSTLTSKAEKVLFFMVESGALYLCIWLVIMTLSFINWDGALVLFLDYAIVQVVGIYPLTIVLLVTMHLSTAEVLHLTDPEAFNPQITIRFASPESPPTVGDIGDFSESDCDVVPHVGGSTGTLAGTLVYGASEK